MSQVPKTLSDEEIAELCDKATPGEWFFTSYSSVQSVPKVRVYDEFWTDERMEDGHTYEHRVGQTCPACGPRYIEGAGSALQVWDCALSGEADDAEPTVCYVKASYGDTATGQRVADAEFIAAARSLVPVLLARAQTAEADLAAMKRGFDRVSYELGDAEARITAVRERAALEIADAKAGEAYHAEINNGVGLAGESSRRHAWEQVKRLVSAALGEA